MLSTAPENAAEAVAIKTRHQTGEEKNTSWEGDVHPFNPLQIIPSEWKVLWQQFTFLPITWRTKWMSLYLKKKRKKKKRELNWMCQIARKLHVLAVKEICFSSVESAPVFSVIAYSGMGELIMPLEPRLLL